MDFCALLGRITYMENSKDVLSKKVNLERPPAELAISMTERKYPCDHCGHCWQRQH